MASTGGGKYKSKRYNDQGKPYERRKSLIGRVTDTVKGMLSPSWLGDFVGNVSSPRPAPSPQTAPQEPATQSNTTSQEGAEAQNLSNNSQPQRSFLQNSGQLNKSVFNVPNAPLPPSTPSFLSQSLTPGTAPVSQPSSSSCSRTQQQPKADSASFASEHLPFVNFTSKSSSLIVNGGGDDRSELSDYSVSTSGCSSLVPHADRSEHMRDLLNDNRIHKMRQEYGGSVTPSKELEARAACTGDLNISKANEKSFLWSTTPSRSRTPQPPAKSRQPSFNLSIFGSSLNASADGSMSQTLPLDSPYYQGRTSFGGAASQKKRKYSETSPNQVVTPNKRQVQARPLNNSVGGVSSSTAKRILDTLEKMSSPLRDAKKIPSYNSSLADSPLSFTPSYGSSLTRRRTLPARSLGGHRSTSDGPPLHALQTPTSLHITRNLQRVTPGSSLPRVPEELRETDSRIIDSGRPDNTARQTPMSGGHSGKMRQERGRQHYSSRRGDEEDDQVEVPNLSTDFKLPAMSLPTFDFKDKASPMPSATASHSKVGGGEAATTFNFSQPIPKSIPEKLSPPSAAQQFQFSSPLHLNKGSDGSTPVTHKMSTASSENTARPAGFSMSGAGGKDNSLTNTASPVQSSNASLAFNFNPATAVRRTSVEPIAESKPVSSDLKQGSVLGALGKSPSTGSPAGGLQAPSELKRGSVMDILGKKGTGSSDSQQKKQESDKPSLSDMFKKSGNTWDCPMCMIQNKKDAAKCVACETSRPGVAPQSTVAPAASKPEASSGAPSLGALFQKPAGSWDCSTCMIQNKADQTKCVACETPKPGSADKAAAAVAKPPQSATKSSTGPSLSSIFQKPAGTWDCDTCMVSNNGEATKCLACETPKPGMRKSTSFTSAGGFKVGPTGGFQLSPVGEEKPASEKSGFSFGGKALDNLAPATSDSKPLTGGFKFGGSVTSDSESTDTKPAIASGGFSFGGNANKQSDGKSLEKANDLEAKPASTGLSNDTPKGGGGFSFKPPTSVNSETLTQSASSGGFQFKQTVTVAVTKTDEPTASDSSSKPPPPYAGGFGFGATVNGTNNDKPTGVAGKQASGFSFGASSTNSESKSITESTLSNTKSVEKPPESNGGFSISGTNTSTANSLPKAGPTAASTGLFQFGANNPVGSGATDSKPLGVSTTGGLNFKGASEGPAIAFKSVATSASAAPGTGTGIFSFGTGNKDSNATSTASQPSAVFQFGSAPPAAAPAASSASNPSLFTFGAAAKDGDKPKAALGATGSMSANSPFGFGSTNSSTVATTAPATSVTTTLFQFKSVNSTNNQQPEAKATPAAPFNFGTKAPESSASGTTAASAAPGVFAFGAGKSGQESSVSATDSVPFVFGGKPNVAAGSGLLGKRAGAVPAASLFEDKKGTKQGESMQIGSPMARSHSTPLFQFGSGGSGNASSSDVVSFTENSGGQSSTAGGPFAFGTKPQTTSAAAPLAFGGGSTSAGGSVFGGANVGASSAFGAASTTGFGSTGAPAPAFGAQATTTASVFGSAAPAPAFGTATVTPAATSAPAFGTGGVFGNATTQSASSTTISSTPNMGFGGSTQQPAAPGGVFQFGGAQASAQSRTAPSSSFTFGQSQPAPAQQPPAPAPSAGFNFSATPSFSFGTPQQQGNNTAFQFNAPSPAAAAPGVNNPFSVQTQPAAPAAPRRSIKKAVRKLRK